MTSREHPDPVDAIAWAGLVVVTLTGALSALLECLLVPLYVGSKPLPIAVLGAVVLNAVLPRLGRACVPRMIGAMLPLLAWLVVVIGFGVMARPEGDVILPGGALQWVTYATLLGGALVGTVSVATSTPLPPRTTPAGEPTPRGRPPVSR